MLALEIGAPSRTINGELSPLIVFCPRIWMYAPEPGSPEFLVICTPDALPESP